MTTRKSVLHSYRTESITLGNAIASCKKQLAHSIALLYSPKVCQLANGVDGQFYDSTNSLVDISVQSAQGLSIFEARIFNENCELRWLNQSDGVGCSVLLTDLNLEEDIDNFELLPSQVEQYEVLEQKYLLWGEKVEMGSGILGWQRLAEARIGKIDIPFSQKFKKKQRVYLKTFEYLAPIDTYGNISILEERLVKLEAES